MKSKITIIIFTFLIFGLSILNMLMPKKQFSENENKFLASLPVFTWNTLFDGSYTEAFDHYIIEHFVFRDSWVGLKTISERLLLKGASNGVYFAEDDYLIEMFNTIDMEKFKDNLDLIKVFTEKVMEEIGVRVDTMLVPTASMILGDKLPPLAPEISQNELLSQAGKVLSNFIDVSSALLQEKDNYIYYKTDHHWTSLGSFHAYNSWREQIGLPKLSLNDFNQVILSVSFYGTTYSKSNYYYASSDTITAYYPKKLENITVDYNLGENITDTIYEKSFLEKKDKYAVFLNANQPIIKINTNNNNGQKLLIIKDSYANTFAQFTLADYEEITIVDLRYYKASVSDYIKKNDIDNVLVLYNLKSFSTDSNLIYLR